MEASHRIHAETLQAFSARLLEAAGSPYDIAEVVARHLVNADLKGYTSHGVYHIYRPPDAGYVQCIEQKTLIPDARPEVLRETPSTALVDGHQGWGHYAAQWAMNLAMEKVRVTGVGTVSLTRCGHIGRLGEYVEQAATEGFISMVTVGGGGPGFGGAAAPFGGAAKALGTNPIAMGVPSVDGRHFIADFATTVIAGAKVHVALMKGTELPPGCLVDKHGEPSCDPSDYLDGGSLLVFGSYKGYALSLLTCLLGGLNGGFDPQAQRMGGTFFQAIDVGAFQPLEEYQQGVASFLDSIRRVPPAPGYSEVLIPGDPERHIEEEQLREGIKLPEEVWTRLLECGEKYGIELGD